MDTMMVIVVYYELDTKCLSPSLDRGLFNFAMVRSTVPMRTSERVDQIFVYST